MLYNSYAEKSYTYEEYKKTAYAHTGSYYTSNSAPCKNRLALKIFAVALLVIVAVTAGFKLAPKAEKINVSQPLGCFETADTATDTLYF